MKNLGDVTELNFWEGKTPCPKFNQEVSKLKEKIEMTISGCYYDFYFEVRKSIENDIRDCITNEILQEVLIEESYGELLDLDNFMDYVGGSHFKYNFDRYVFGD